MMIKDIIVIEVTLPMNINKLFWINIMITLLFLGFNITVTYFPKLDDFFGSYLV